MKAKIFVTRQLPEPAMEKIRAYFDTTENREDRVLTKEEIIAGACGCKALLCLLTDPIDAELMDSCPELKVISNYAVGFNNIDLAAATARRLPVCITPGVLTETTADAAWALIMSTSRRVVEGDRMVRAGDFHGWGPMMLLGGDVYGKTLGIVGMGRIGLAVAKRAQGFGMKILYTSSLPKKDCEKEMGARHVELDELLRESDFVSLHVPLMKETHHLIGKRELGIMKSTAYLINTARGPVVDEKALVECLRNRDIAGAGLDVFEEEPKLAEGLVDLDNTVLLPHIASASIETRTQMGLLAAENAIAVMEGKRPHAIANPEVFRELSTNGA